MAKKWTSFLKNDPQEKKKGLDETPSINFEEILQDHEDIQELLKEKEALEHALKNAPGTGRKEEGDPRFRESEIIPLAQKKKQEKKWSDKREALLAKKREEKKAAATWEEKRSKTSTIKRPEKKQVDLIDKRKKPATDLLPKRRNPVSKTGRKPLAKKGSNEVAQWLKERAKGTKVFQEKKQEAQQWLTKKEDLLRRSKEDLKTKREESSKWIKKQEQTKEKALQALKNKRMQEALPEVLKKPAEDVYALLDKKNKKSPVEKLSMDIKKVVSKKEMPFKKPTIKKKWEDILDKKREAVSQTKKHVKEIEQKMNVAPKAAKDLWEKRDLLKKQRIQEALAQKKEALKAEARKQARAQERKQQRKDERFS